MYAGDDKDKRCHKCLRCSIRHAQPAAASWASYHRRPRLRFPLQAIASKHWPLSDVILQVCLAVRAIRLDLDRVSPDKSIDIELPLGHVDAFLCIGA